MNWTNLHEKAQLRGIDQESANTPVLIFKHSTRCGVSATALDRLERNWQDNEMDIPTYFLDLIAYRQVSDAIAAHYGVEHASPQVLMIRNGKCVYHASHFGIQYQQLKDAVKAGV